MCSRTKTGRNEDIHCGHGQLTHSQLVCEYASCVIKESTGTCVMISGRNEKSQYFP